MDFDKYLQTAITVELYVNNGAIQFIRALLSQKIKCCFVSARSKEKW